MAWVDPSVGSVLVEGCPMSGAGGPLTGGGGGRGMSVEHSKTTTSF